MTLHSQIRATSSATGQILTTSEKHESHNDVESETYASCWTWPTGSCETAAEIQLKKMDWPTQQPFLRQDDLGLRLIGVSVLLYTVSQFVAAANHLSVRRITGRKISMVLLLAYVPLLQVTASLALAPIALWF